MKKVFTMMGVAAMTAMTMAQNVTTHSVYDVNQNGEVNVADVVSVAQAALQEVNPEETQQYVTGEDLSILLNNVLQELSDIKRRLNYVMEKTEIGNPFDPDENGIITNGHEYVDLGVVVDGKPVYWATTNIGAEKSADYGLYFAWGETVGYGSKPMGEPGELGIVEIFDGHLFNWKNYSSDLGGNDSRSMNKYCTSEFYGTVDNITVLEPDDDAAHVNWQGTWRMPTFEEQQALRTQCNWIWTTMTNSAGEEVNGFKVSNKSNSNKFIFLPAAGHRSGNILEGADVGGYYWTSTLYKDDNSKAYSLLFFSSTGNGWERLYRFRGQPVRPVCQ